MTAAHDRSFDDLVAEGASVPIEGWDFGWFEGRATEQRPSWGYARLAAERVAAPGIDAVLDLQTGGGEVYAEILSAATARPDGTLPRTVWATEGWPPNYERARERLELYRGDVVLVEPGAPLPFDRDRFDLVLSRHPVATDWQGIARVLRPGGVVLSQQVGSGSNRALYEFFLGANPPGETDDRSPARLVEGARAAGLTVVDLLHESTAVEFFDVAAVIVFLRKVLWTVPGFTVDAYRDRLAAMHAHIVAHGSFLSHSERVLIEARAPRS